MWRTRRRAQHARLCSQTKWSTGRVSCTAFETVQATRASSCRCEVQLSCMSPPLRGQVARCCSKVIVSLEVKQAVRLLGQPSSIGQMRLDSAYRCKHAGLQTTQRSTSAQASRTVFVGAPELLRARHDVLSRGRWPEVPRNLFCSLQGCRGWDAATGANSDVWNRFHFAARGPHSSRRRVSGDIGRGGALQSSSV